MYRSRNDGEHAGNYYAGVGRDTAIERKLRLRQKVGLPDRFGTTASSNTGADEYNSQQMDDYQKFLNSLIASSGLLYREDGLDDDGTDIEVTPHEELLDEDEKLTDIPAEVVFKSTTWQREESATDPDGSPVTYTIKIFG